MRRTFVALALAVALPLPVLAGQVTVKEGETLSEIAERHGISLNQLMQINGIRDADLVEAGRTLTLPGSGGSRSAPSGSRASNGTVTVKPGETLSEIAERHGVSLSRLMQINGIRDADQVQAGQTLRLQGAAPTTARSTTPPAPAKPNYPAGASEHVVRSGESLSTIASGYGIGLSKLIAINGISDPDHVEAGTRLKLKGTPPAPAPRPAVSTAATTARPAARPQPSTPVAARPQSTTPPAAARPVAAAPPAPRPAAAPAARPVAAATPVARPAAATTAATSVAMAKPDWRSYGPLQVNWAGWQPMGGSMVAPTLNGEGQTLYVAINCGARKLNSTTPTGAWQSWSDPSGAHEQQLVSDYCRTRS